MSDSIPKILNVHIEHDFTIIVMFDNMFSKRIDISKIKRLSKMTKEEFENFTYTMYAIIWSDELDVCENELWEIGEII